MKRVPTRAGIAFLALVLLLVGYLLVVATYVSGLAGRRSNLTAAEWERVMRSSLLAGPIVALFLLLVLLSWAGRWPTGVLPFATGAVAALSVARLDAGLARWTDALWALPLLVVAFASDRKRAGRRPEE